MATPIDGRPRPALTPLWTPSWNSLDTFAHPSLPTSRSHVFSPSPRSPKSLPTPVYPSASHDGAMRMHERSLVERLDQSIRRAKKGNDVSPPGSASTSRPLSPITEGDASARSYYSSTSLPVPTPRRTLPPPATPASAGAAFPRRQTLVAETRSMLLAGVTEESERRQSAPLSRQRASPDKTQRFLKQLRAWGPVYLGDTKTADVFVQAVALRRPSDTSSTSSENSNTAEEPVVGIRAKPAFLSRRTTLRARVRPRDIDRKPFLIQREFDIEELRATIPDPLPAGSPIMDATAGRRASFAAGPPSPNASSRAGFSPLDGIARRRSSSARHGMLPFGHGPRSGAGRDARASMRGSNAMPIHLEYARSHLPVLAALMVSGHVREGDVIDVPLPHPEAWPQTVEYVYTGQRELTIPVRENIIHLAGKA